MNLELRQGCFSFYNLGDEMQIDRSQENKQIDSPQQQSCKVDKVISPSFLQVEGGGIQKTHETARHKIQAVLIEEYVFPAIKGKIKTITFANQDKIVSEGRENLLRMTSDDLDMTLLADKYMKEVVEDEALKNEFGDLEF